MKIQSVIKNSLADRAGLKAGDSILSVNGSRVRDQIDLRFHAAEENLSILAVRGGRRLQREMRKQQDKDLGIELEEPSYRRCANKCLFCFVDQMPKGLRRSLYFKDEDFRLSFLHGNYLTLTGFSRADRDRVIAQGLSPLYVSVHATDEGVRRRLLGAGRPAPIMPLLRDLASHGIRIHTQIVLCPGINDGRILDGTVDDLAGLHPGVASIAVVPVGLTKHRRGLPRLKPVSRPHAREIIAKHKPRQVSFRKRFNRTVLYFSDELYMLAGLDMPGPIWYDDYPQLENGVGMSRLFLERFRECSLTLPPKLKKDRNIVVVTGKLAEPVLEPFVQRLNKIKGLRIRIVSVENGLFGSSVTVSGLLAGRDIVAALEKEAKSDLYALPGNALNGRGLFIDGMADAKIRELLAPARVTFGLEDLIGTLGSWAG